jgi:hypothetical protein
MGEKLRSATVNNDEYELHRLNATRSKACNMIQKSAIFMRTLNMDFCHSGKKNPLSFSTCTMQADCLSISDVPINRMPQKSSSEDGTGCPSGQLTLGFSRVFDIKIPTFTLHILSMKLSFD